MASIEVAINIPVPVEEVWEELSDVSRHVDWMADAEEIEFIGTNAAGLGTQFRCRTKVGPLRTTDRMTITEWEPDSVMAVEHVGLFKGVGRFELHALAGGEATRFVWAENLTFPWYFAGALGATVAKPILTAVWRGNLKRLRAQVLSGEQG